jgi:hypothetical protein
LFLLCASFTFADTAVRIAAALGVTVEYLITGNVQQEGPSQPVPDSRAILKNLEALNRRDRKIVLNLIKFLKETEDAGKKT